MAPTTRKSVPKPDFAVQQQALDAIDKKIQEATQKYAELKGLGPQRGPNDSAAHEKKQALASQLHQLKHQRTLNQETRQKLVDKQRALKLSLQRRIDALKLKRSKFPFQSVADLDKRVSELEEQIEGGQLTLVAERKALDTVASLQRGRKVVEGCHSEQEAIDRDLKQLETINAQLEEEDTDPLSDQFHQVQSELKVSKAEAAKLQQDKQEALQLRAEAKKNLDELYAERRAQQNAFHEAKAKYNAWVQEDRKRRDEERRQQRLEEERERKQAQIEEAQALADTPAFAHELATCASLLHYLDDKVLPAPLRANNCAEPLQTLPPTINIPKGAQVLNRGSNSTPHELSSKSKKRTHRKKRHDPESAQGTNSSQLGRTITFPLAVMEQFWEVGLTPPATMADVQACRKELVEKQQWYLDNQDRVAAETKAKASDRVAKLQQEMRSLTVNKSTVTKSN
ncbi:multicopy suppressor of BFA (Brefeldin A) [Dimargaris verticillata]|uniref:Multicopy suppressor of BFA (Brefeldin A) n=1 Tax=Dimargaris verticillata TaxID=2761393 RepID=A0A9W8B165_9FUNG|nr:multicopy suppressor of BFA (Brefeldin A) [Dimargaris verticillata]